MSEIDELRERIKEVTGWSKVDRPRIVTDTSDFLKIQRGDIVRLSGRDFVIEGTRYETRFGISDQPKYWVFGATELATGKKKIVKAVFKEEFDVHIGHLRIHCYRSPQKEGRVLDLTRGDTRFMQGHTLLDEKNNHVRVVDFIRGPSVFQRVYDIDLNHEAYCHEVLPSILQRLAPCLDGIRHLHKLGEYHGDIRNDHIIIDEANGSYRWIDFDLNQNVSDFDVWSVGNILAYIVGKGIISYHNVLKSDHFSDQIKRTLTVNDASAFFEYRIINLRKLYPYVPTRLNDILMHFSVKSEFPYSNMDEFISDFYDMLKSEYKLSIDPENGAAMAETPDHREEDR